MGRRFQLCELWYDIINLYIFIYFVTDLIFYTVQLQKFSAKIDKIGFQKFKQNLNEEELLIAEEFLVDAKKLSKINSDIADVKIFYRKKLKESPAYRINHHELQKAIDQGIKIVDETNIVEIIIDLSGI